MGETLKYLLEIERILQLDEENKESILENSIEGIKGEEDSIFCHKKGSFVIEQFINQYSKQQLDLLYSNIDNHKFFVILEDFIGSKVFSTIFQRYQIRLEENKEKEKEIKESILFLMKPFLALEGEEFEEKIKNKYVSNALSELIELIRKCVVSNWFQVGNVTPISEFISKVENILVNEEKREINIESISLITKLIECSFSSMKSKMGNIITNNKVPITDEDWSIIVEALIKQMNEKELDVFEKKYLITVEESENGQMSCQELLTDHIGNHLIQTFLDCKMNVTQLINQIVNCMNVIIDNKYFMLIIKVIQNVHKLQNKQEEKKILMNIKTKLENEGNIYEEGRKNWMRGVSVSSGKPKYQKGKKYNNNSNSNEINSNFIDYGYSLLLQELIKKDAYLDNSLHTQFVDLKQRSMEQFLQHKNGSRVVERLIETNSEKQNAQMVEKLRGKLSEFIKHQISSFVIQKLFFYSAIKEKEKIAEEWKSNYKLIANDFYGRKVLEKIKFVEFNENPVAWKRKMNMKKQLIESLN